MTAGGAYTLKKSTIEKFPIKINANYQENIIEIVKNILELKELNLETDTLYFENEIDQLVYGLYDLTGEEIEIIENSNQ